MQVCFLYEISLASMPDAKYYLATDIMAYFLSEDGILIAKTAKTPKEMLIVNKIIFEDLPQY